MGKRIEGTTLKPWENIQQNTKKGSSEASIAKQHQVDKITEWRMCKSENWKEKDRERDTRLETEATEGAKNAIKIHISRQKKVVIARRKTKKNIKFHKQTVSLQGPYAWQWRHVDDGQV